MESPDPVPERKATEIGASPGTGKGEDGIPTAASALSIKNPEALKPKSIQPTTITDILREQKVLAILLGFTDFARMLSLRLICGAWNEILSNSPRLLDACKYVLFDAKSLECFANSGVSWKRVTIAYWPQTFDRYAIGSRTYAFWEVKAPHIIDVTFKMQNYVRMKSYDFLEMLRPLQNSESLVLASNLSQFNFEGNFGPSDWMSLGQTFTNLKEITVVQDLASSSYHHNFQMHIQNCFYLLKLIPPGQLETFNVTSTETVENYLGRHEGTTGFLANFLENSLQEHIPSLKNFRYDHLIPPATLSGIFNSSIQLKRLSLNLSSIRVYEKSKVDLSAGPETGYAQVKAWRSFHQFLQRQAQLDTFEIYVQELNKKIAKQLFPVNIHGTLRTLCLNVDVCATEEALGMLSKLTSLKSLTLHIHNFPALKQNPKSNFFQTLPPTLESIVLISIAYPPTYFIELVKRLPKLRTLRVYSGSSMITDESVQAILQHLLDLRELFLLPAYQVGDAGFLGKAGTTRNTELRRLMLRDAQITNSTLRRGMCFKELDYLDINGCTKVSHRGILELVHQTPQLRWLHIVGIPFLPSAEKKLRPKLPNLYIYKGSFENEQQNFDGEHDDDEFPEKYEMVELDPTNYNNAWRR